jgi:UDP-N-acetylmuramoyl-tripeptide--D-alanyl-D-alanine ligase
VVVTGTELVAASGGRHLAGPSGVRFTRTCLDSRRAEPGDLFFAIIGPRHDGHHHVAEALAAGAAGAVVSRPPEEPPPPDRTLVEVYDTTRALGDLATAVRRREALEVVAVTGSTGKTTTKELAAAALATDRATGCNPGNLNNLWGLPLSLLNLPGDTRTAVLEMGMNAPGEIARLTEIADPDVGVITNVGPVHLEFFEDVEGIARAKGELFETMRPGATAVVNADDPRTRDLGERFPGRTVSFSTEGAGADLAATEVVSDLAEGTRFVLEGHPVRLHLAGRHAAANALAALAAADALGVARHRALGAMAEVRPLPGRGRVEHLADGVVLVDETYNANPVALTAVLSLLGDTRWPGRKVLALGDMLELGPSGPELHRTVGRQALAAGVSLLIGVGPLAAESCRAAAAGADTARFATSVDAAAAAGTLMRPGDLVLVKGSRGTAMERFADALRGIGGGGD